MDGSTLAPLSPFSTTSIDSSALELQTPTVLAPSTPLQAMDIAVFHDEAALTAEVRLLLDTQRELMVAVHAKLSTAPPTLTWIAEQFPFALRALIVVSPLLSAEDTIKMTVGVFVLASPQEVAMVSVPGRLGSSVSVTSFSTPALPVSRSSFSVPGSKDMMQIDELYELGDGTAGVCAVMTLGDVKKLLPADEADCRARVLMVKRCHRLGSRCSSKLKAYFDLLLGKDEAVEHVLMLPLKARCANKYGRTMPPKTGFVVFRDPTDAMMARALGGEHLVDGSAMIKVETYDGL